MNYIKKLAKIAAIMLLSIPSSCTDYLSIQPQDQFLEEGVYSSTTSIQNALNGVYLAMAGTNSYGGQMTMTTIDALAQYYNTAAMENLRWDAVTNYEFGEEHPLDYFSSIWSETYSIIMNVNNFISRITNVPESIISNDRKNILLGEAYALRAFLHFDMLRLYGPVYSLNPTNPAIPYVTSANEDISPLLPANNVLDSVIADLDRAEQYLQNDPVRTAGGSEPVTGLNAEEDFYRMRSRRMNYFAVLALHARTSLYAGDQTNAQAYAQRTIDETQGIFFWTSPTATQANAQFPDRIFSTEVFFGVENINLYARHDAYFSSALTVANILTALPDRLIEIFSNSNDYRRTSSWFTDQSTSSYVSTNTFYKFEEVLLDPDGTNSNVRFFQPLIRLSEMYYILSECTASSDYLNTVRFNRGLPNVNVTGTTALETEIRNEYRREFWGEGQTFFYFKRKNLTSIPGAKNATSTINMTARQYVIPLPLDETNNR